MYCDDFFLYEATIMECRTLNTYQRPYASGTVNPVERETITYFMAVNSKFRSVHNTKPDSHCMNVTANTGYIDDVSDFTIELQEPLVNVISLKLASIDMNNSYYPISNYLGTNVFSIKTFTYDIYTFEEQITENVMYLPDGIYTEQQLLDTINEQLSNSSDTALTSIELKYDEISYKYSFSVKYIDPEIEMTFHLSFANPNYPNRKLYYNLGWMMGFRNLTYTMSENYNVVETHTNPKGIQAEAPANLKGTSYFFMEVNDFNSNNPPVINYNCNTEYSFNLRNILAKIPNTNEVGIEKYYDNMYKKRQYFGPVRIQKMKFRLLDENGRQVQLNHSDYTINLEVETLNNLC